MPISLLLRTCRRDKGIIYHFSHSNLRSRRSSRAHEEFERTLLSSIPNIRQSQLLFGLRETSAGNRRRKHERVRRYRLHANHTFFPSPVTAPFNEPSERVAAETSSAAGLSVPQPRLCLNKILGGGRSQRGDHRKIDGRTTYEANCCAVLP